MFILIKKVSKEKNDEFLSNHILDCCSNIYLIKMAATNYLIIEEKIKRITELLFLSVANKFKNAI